ncbi:MAG: hypothetical protein IKK73_02980 [Akkermansia sp.]|nr:hypothetical protein [Akkermansia sp.]
MKKNKRRSRLALALILGSLTQVNASAANLMPLPENIFENKENTNPVLDVTKRAISVIGGDGPEIPDTLKVTNTNGTISYNKEKNAFFYTADKETPIRLRTDSGSDIHTPTLEAHLNTSEAVLSGPMTIYQDEILVRSEEGGYYNWKDNRTAVSKVRLKMHGLLIRGSRIEYNTDVEGKEYITVYDAYVTVDDVEKPSAWVGTGTLTVYPGDYGRVSRLSIATDDADYTVPVLGWFTFSHSLNPREGYLPGVGSKSHWGAYLENSYGILFGNRRVDGFMPTADYLATLHLDYRTRRGLAYGLDLEDIAMTDKHEDMTGFSAYFLSDDDPNVNPTDTPREPIDRQRYRIALQALWDISPEADKRAKWQVATNINILSDRYVLRDFFEDFSQIDDKPDNTVRLLRRTDTTQSMIYTRFAPNDFYETNERLEASFYRVRSAIGNTGINYETNNSASIMRQYLPHESRLAYKTQIDQLRDGKLKEYYTHMMNSESFVRVNTTHEFTTNLTAFKFLNITPKAGGAYTGYYDVGGIGTENRFLGYVGCDFNMKFHNRYPDFKWKSFGLDGLNHLIQPYATYSQGSISSSNSLVPQIDTWSSLWSGNTSPMPLDMAGFTSIDSWGNWHVWRMGMKNVLTSRIEDDRIRVLLWDTFVDYNVDNPNSDSNFSNLYNVIKFYPSRRMEFSLYSQTPTIDNGAGYTEYGSSLRLIPCAWLETYLSYRSIQDHPLLEDAEQVSLRANVRINEKYTFSVQWYYDIESGTMPIQQYAIFRHVGAWYIGANIYMRDNGGKKETGFGLSFTLGETATTLPVDLL